MYIVVRFGQLVVHCVWFISDSIPFLVSVCTRSDILAKNVLFVSGILHDKCPEAIDIDENRL